MIVCSPTTYQQLIDRGIINADGTLTEEGQRSHGWLAAVPDGEMITREFLDQEPAE